MPNSTCACLVTSIVMSTERNMLLRTRSLLLSRTQPTYMTPCRVGTRANERVSSECDEETSRRAGNSRQGTCSEVRRNRRWRCPERKHFSEQDGVGTGFSREELSRTWNQGNRQQTIDEHSTCTPHADTRACYVLHGISNLRKIPRGGRGLGSRGC